MIVWQFMVVIVKAMGYADAIALEINRFDLSGKEIDPLEQLADGIHDVGQVQIAGCHLVQHWGEQEEIVPVHERYLDIRIASQRVIKMNRRVQPGKTAAKDDNTSFLCFSHDYLSSTATHKAGNYRSATSQNTLIEPLALVSFLKSSVKFSRPRTGSVSSRLSQPGYSASAWDISRTPISKYSRLAFTVPTMTLFPSTNSRLMRSAGTRTMRSPPVTLDKTRTPFFPSACMLSKTTPELPVASKITSNGPNFFPPSIIGSSCVIT